MNHNKYYCALVGSKRFGVDIERSDTDYVVLVLNVNEKTNKNFTHAQYNEHNYHYYRNAHFIENLFETENSVNPWYTLGTLFSIPVIETDFSKYLLENREALVKSNLRRFGNSLLNHVKIIGSRNSCNRAAGKRFLKSNIYAMLLLNAYINYAKNEITFEAAFKPSEELIKFIKGIRLGTVSYKDQIEKLNSMLAEAELFKSFYNKEPDLITFNKIKSDMKALLNVN